MLLALDQVPDLGHVPEEPDRVAPARVDAVELVALALERRRHVRVDPERPDGVVCVGPREGGRERGRGTRGRQGAAARQGEGRSALGVARPAAAASTHRDRRLRASGTGRAGPWSRVSSEASLGESGGQGDCAEGQRVVRVEGGRRRSAPASRPPDPSAEGFQRTGSSKAGHWSRAGELGRGQGLPGAARWWWRDGGGRAGKPGARPTVSPRSPRARLSAPRQRKPTHSRIRS